jgi:hypothetical protein
MADQRPRPKRVLRTFPVPLSNDPELPSGFWDPKWSDPVVASRVAHAWYRRACFDGRAFPIAPLTKGSLGPAIAKSKVDESRFVLPPALEEDGFRGGSYGQLYRRVSLGASHGAVEIHAHGACFGIAREGRYFLAATAGWRGTAAEVEIAISVAFELAGEEADPDVEVEAIDLGAPQGGKIDFLSAGPTLPSAPAPVAEKQSPILGFLRWTRRLTAPGEEEVRILGRDPLLEARGSEIVAARVIFESASRQA